MNPIDMNFTVCYNSTVLILIVQSVHKRGGRNLSLITVDLRDRKQLYEQLVDNIKNLVLTGELKADEKLPSVRSLARELGINPNTIQKAYSELERCGVILTLPGRGSIVVAQVDDLKREQLAALTEKLIQLAHEAKNAGITREKFITAAKNAYEGGAEHD